MLFSNIYRLQEGQREYIDKKGIRVVVGHYMGSEAKNNKLSKGIISIKRLLSYFSKSRAYFFQWHTLDSQHF